MKSFIPSEVERRAIATLIDAAVKAGAVRDVETFELLSKLKVRTLAGLPPAPKKTEPPKTGPLK